MKTMIFVFCSFAWLSQMCAQTPACNTAEGAVSAMWDKYGGWLPEVSFATWASKKSLALQGWDAIAQNSFATIGPRSLDFNGVESGVIMGQTNRTFITPPSFKNSITITIHKTDGKARTGVTICTTTRNGQQNQIVSHTFPNGNNAMTESFTIPNAKGKVISINMRNYSVGNKFHYSIDAD